MYQQHCDDTSYTEVHNRIWSLSDRSNEHIVFGQRSLPIPSVAVCVCCTIKIVLFITLLSAKDHIVPENHTAEQCV